MPKLILDNNVIFIDIELTDTEKSLLLFDSIQVWRSVDNIQAYTELTADSELPAIADGTITGTWNLNGLTLIVIKNSADPVTITFNGTDPFDLQSVINQINLVIPKFASKQAVNLNRLRLTSDVKGLASNLTLSGTAVSVLGLPTTKLIGKCHRPDLTYPTNKYRFYDLDGNQSYYYKVRFYNSANKAASPFSSIIRATPIQTLQDSSLVTASIILSDNTGMPIEGRRIIIVPISVKKIETAAVLSTQDRIILKTDQFGRASTKLAKGVTVRVFFEGTGFEREIIVPNTDFNILDAASTYLDPFTIVTTPPLAIRVS